MQPATMISAVGEFRGLLESSEESYSRSLRKFICISVAGITAAFLVAILILCFILQSLRRFVDESRRHPIHPATAPASSSPGQGRRRELVVHIPVHIYEAAAAAGPSSSGADTGSYNELQVCTICLGEFENGECVSVLPRCKHMFHGDCIRLWLPEKSVNCPICRVPAVSAARTTVRVAEMTGVGNPSLSLSALLALGFSSRNAIS